MKIWKCVWRTEDFKIVREFFLIVQWLFYNLFIQFCARFCALLRSLLCALLHALLRELLRARVREYLLLRLLLRAFCARVFVSVCFLCVFVNDFVLRNCNIAYFKHCIWGLASRLNLNRNLWCLASNFKPQTQTPNLRLTQTVTLNVRFSFSVKP